jgi:sec-independent protein translocase protein TatB
VDVRERVFSGQTKELSVFDLSIGKLLVLAVIALVIFGPNELPKMASQAGRALRDLRRIAEGAKNDLREGLGPEFADFDIEDLNPKRFVQKHLLDDLNGDSPRSAAAPSPGAPRASGALLAPGERPPFDSDAT